jgi:hypothetical protein
MSSTLKVLYHCTSAENYLKIVATGGINPKYSKGKIKRCYYCDKEEIPWAISHSMWRHDWKVEQVMVLRIKAKAHDFCRAGRWPFWATQIVYSPFAVESAVEVLKRTERNIMLEEWLENGELWPKSDG